MATQHKGEITDIELSPAGDGSYALSIVVAIPDLYTTTILRDKGTLRNLQNKYPFIDPMPVINFAPARLKYCLVEKEDDDSFRYAGYLTPFVAR